MCAKGADAELDEIQNSAEVHVNHPVAGLLEQTIATERVGEVIGLLRNAGVGDADIHVTNVLEGLSETAPIGYVAVSKLDGTGGSGLRVVYRIGSLCGVRAATRCGRCKVAVEGFVDWGDVEDVDVSTPRF